MNLSDVEILKPLVERVVELAERPEEEYKKELWAKHNALMPTDKIPVCVTYEGIPGKQWELMFGENHLKCSGGVARTIEFDLKRRIWMAENAPDDHVVWKAVLIPAVSARGYEWGVPLEWESTGDELGARHIIAPFKDKIDVSLLKPAQTEVDEAATKSRLDEAAELVEDRLEVHPRYPNLGHAPFEIAVQLRGMERIFMDVYDEPDALHAMMEFITSAFVADHKRRALKGWLNCPPDPSGRFQIIPVFRHICSFLPEGWRDRDPLLSDEWAYVTAQSASSYGPAHFEEFVHRYNCRLAELFTNKTVYYHGCEQLDHKLDIIASLPNLRRHHVSPWSSVQLAAQKYQGTVNLEVHCHPGKVFFGGAEDDMRNEIKGFIGQAGGHPMNLNLSDIHSVNGNPATLGIWARIAQSESQR